MVCFFEIIYGEAGDENQRTKLIEGQDFVEDIWDSSVKDATGKNITDLKEAEKFVPPNAEILEVNELCDDELLEHLEVYYREIE